MEAGREQSVLTVAGVEALFAALRDRGYRVVGPTVRDQAIVYDDIATVDDLPRGWTDEQDGGHYRLNRRDDDALFGYVVGPHSWKKFLH
ncbi:MAG: sulfite reductase subunit A, partial [Bauldia litoralis]